MRWSIGGWPQWPWPRMVMWVLDQCAYHAHAYPTLSSRGLVYFRKVCSCFKLIAAGVARPDISHLSLAHVFRPCISN
jgi:hypothetical protein